MPSGRQTTPNWTSLSWTQNLKPGRPWLTTIMDDYSRAICGYMLFLGAPSALNTALALRQGIWPKNGAGWPMCGIPDILYVDHGSDFTSNHLAQTAKDLHFEIACSTVARPKGKIERFYGTINTELLTELPGRLGPRAPATGAGTDTQGAGHGDRHRFHLGGLPPARAPRDQDNTA